MPLELVPRETNEPEDSQLVPMAEGQHVQLGNSIFEIVRVRGFGKRIYLE